jgi:transposase
MPQLSWTVPLPRLKRGLAVGKTKKGKGTKWMLLVDGNGIPLALTIRSAQQSEMKLALEVVDQAKRRPKRVVADRGYDWKVLRKELRARKITPYIPKRQGWRSQKKHPMSNRLKYWYRKRWVVERSFAWLQNYRKLTVRWEHSTTTYAGLMHLALVMLCLGRVLK